MNQQKIIDTVSTKINVSQKKIEVVLGLLNEGNTVPFIARYRKEATGNLNEDQIREVYKEFESANKLEKKKEETIKKIDEKGMLTDELVNKINSCIKIQEVEDVYLPFKEKKKTKATEAIKKGLEPLANYILDLNDGIKEEAKKYLNEEVKNIEEAIEGAQHIISEIVSDNSEYRKDFRDSIWKFGKITSKVKKNGEELDEGKKYVGYYDFTQSIDKLPSYRILAFNRAEKEKIVTVNIDYDSEYVVNKVSYDMTKNSTKESSTYIIEAIEDAFKRLIFPSIKREVRKELTLKADEDSIKIFSSNFEKLIMQKPLKNKWILGLDPAFRTGCKIAVIDNNLTMVEVGVIYPHEPKNQKKESEKIIRDLLNKYPIEQIVIGNGTASRETEEFVDELNTGISYSLVSEAGASVYSASKLAQAEFPDLTVEYRSAISIARRVADPMAELVKIDPKSIGVGQYQHDVDQKKLSESLEFTTIKVVNQVGVDINTASKELLQFISGLDKGLAKNIVEHKEKNGNFKSRKDILKVKRLGESAYKQAAGFLKVLDGIEELDATFIHPEDYSTAKEILKVEPNIKENGVELSKETIDLIINKKEVTFDKVTELVNYLKKPNLDIRDEIKTADFSRKIRKIEDLKVGDEVQGEVRNILQFGAFVDIGLKNDGLVHISELSKSFVKDVSDVVQIGDIKTFKVKEILLEQGKIQLSLKEMS